MITSSLPHIEKQFTTISRPSAVRIDTWEFRKIVKEGCVLSNCFLSCDLDKDGEDELVMGSTEGNVVIMKTSWSKPVATFTVQGTVSTVLFNTKKDVLIVVSLEAILTVIANVSQVVISSSGATHFPLKAYIIPANVTCGEIVSVGVKQELIVLGSSDRRVYFLSSTDITILHSYFMESPVSSLRYISLPLLSSHPNGPPTALLIIATTAHMLVLDIAEACSGKHHSKSTINLYSNLLVPWTVDVEKQRSLNFTPGPNVLRRKKSGVPTSSGVVSDSDMNLNKGRRNQLQVLCNFALMSGTSDLGVPIKKSGEATCSALLLYCTEDGFAWMYEVMTGSTFNEIRLVWSILLECIVYQVYILPLFGGCALVLSTSGNLYIINREKNALIIRISADATSFVPMLSGKRLAVATVSTEELILYLCPCKGLGVEGFTHSYSMAASTYGVSPDLNNNLLMLYTLLFNSNSKEETEIVKTTRVRELIMSAYTDKQWDRLEKLALTKSKEKIE
eukprot:Tbor_TRINITY_DN2663_c0_g1::TRINITY_DN2663_c0_g1_i1::g.17890::m.17890